MNRCVNIKCKGKQHPLDVECVGGACLPLPTHHQDQYLEVALKMMIAKIVVSNLA